MTRIRRLVLDVLKPHEPAVPALGGAIADVAGVEGVNVSLVEIDQEVENVTVTVEGDHIEYDAVVEAITEFGASVHSVDEFACGDRLVEAADPAQY